MKNIKVLALVFLSVAGLLAATSCKKERLKKEEARRVSIKVERPSDLSEFAKETQIGVFFGAPLSESNVQASLAQDGKAVLSKDVKWQDKQTQKTTITLYSPYDKSITSLMSAHASANADQSTLESFLGSEVLFGKVEATPLQPVSVSLSRINVLQAASFELPAGEVVADVAFDGVFLSDNLSFLTGNVTPSTMPATRVKPFLFSDESGVLTYKAFVAASSEPATVVVAFKSGREVRFMAGEKVYQIPEFDFTSVTEPGVYSSAGAVVYKPEEYDQFVYGSDSSGLTFRALSLENGTELSLSFGVKSFTVGGRTSMTARLSGLDAPQIVSSTLTVLKIEDGKVWLEDSANGLFYLIISE